MGNGQAKPAPPAVDLLPPRFDVPPPAMDRISASPFTYLFGEAKRRALFDNFYATEGARVRLHLSPPTDERLRVAVEAQERNLALDSAAIGASFADAPADGRVIAAVSGSFSRDAGLALQGSAVSPEHGLGSYVRLPLTHMLLRRVRRAAAGTGVTLMSDADPDDPADAAAAAGPAAAPSAAVARPASLAVGRGSHSLALSGGNVMTLASPHDELPAAGALGSDFAEAGVAWSAADQSVSIGLHTSPFAEVPIKAWVIGAPVGSGLTIGAQVSANVGETLRDPRGLCGIRSPLFAVGGVRPTTATATAAAATATRSAAAYVSRASRSHILDMDLDFAISMRQDPIYEASLAFESARRQLVLGYVHNMTLRRQVYNPLEADNVKGIYNYVDIGIEFRQSIDGPPAVGSGGGIGATATPKGTPTTPSATPATPFSRSTSRGGGDDDALPDMEVTIGGSWQINRHWLAKAKLGSGGAAVSVTGRTWSQPDLAWTLTAGLRPGSTTGSLLRGPGEPFVGGFVSFGTAGRAVYRRAVEGEQRTAQYRQFQAREDLSNSRSARVEADAVTKAPPGSPAERRHKVPAWSDAYESDFQGVVPRGPSVTAHNDNKTQASR